MLNTSITTERLILRPYQLSDAQRLRELADNYAIASRLARLPHPYPAGEAERWIGTHEALRASGEGYVFAIENDANLLGSIGLERGETGEYELGYWLGEPYWNLGFASEAARGILAFGFEELGLSYVRARCTADNRASARVLAKAGFLTVGRSRKLHSVRRAEVDMVHVVLVRDAFVGGESRTKQVYNAA